MQSLPPVARSFNTYCKKCDSDRYHTVIAHKTSVSAKVQCEVCKKNSTFSVAKKNQRSFETKRPRSIGLANWEEVKKSLNKEGAVSYGVKSTFAEKDTINHPKFGLGYVMKSEPTKIEVVFEDGIKSLVHNR